MRQFITYSFILGGAVLGYFAFKDSITFAPNIGTLQATAKPVTPSQTTQKVAQNLVTPKVRKDRKHESKHHLANPVAQRPRAGEDEGSSISADEIESISSIYQNQEGQRDSQPGSSLNSPVAELPKARPISPIPGVKVAAWVRSRQDHLNTEVPDPKIGSGMRVFLNCVELKKKGASPLEERECDKVLARKDSVEKPSLHFE